jgi:hypothetical protein
MKIVIINCNEISDWDSFHSTFKKAFGFPDFYGENMNAWNDCMTHLDTDFSTIQVEEGTCLVLQLDSIISFRERCPEIYAALIESSAFVNWRRIEMGDSPILILSFYE